MKMQTVQIRVPTDDEVTDIMLRDIVANQAYFLMGLHETAGGAIYWQEARVLVKSETRGES